MCEFGCNLLDTLEGGYFSPVKVHYAAWTDQAKLSFNISLSWNRYVRKLLQVLNKTLLIMKNWITKI